jgi:hypothetical protein
MPIPFLASRIEKPHNFSGLRVQTTQITSFEEIAKLTRPAKVRRHVSTAVLPGNDVFQMERVPWKIDLVKAAILASMACSRGYLGAKRFGHRPLRDFLRSACALA